MRSTGAQSRTGLSAWRHCKQNLTMRRRPAPTVGREQAQAEHPEQATESRPGPGAGRPGAGEFECAGNISLLLLSRPVVSSAVRPVDRSPPGSSVHGILQQEHWSGWPGLLQGTFLPPPPGVEPASLAGGFFTCAPRECRRSC